jgi:hypothetical protein
MRVPRLRRKSDHKRDSIRTLSVPITSPVEKRKWNTEKAVDRSNPQINGF